MSVRAVRTRLKPGMEESYDQLHSVVPDELAADLVRRGHTEWLIFRHGQDLFHVIFTDGRESTAGDERGEAGATDYRALVSSHLEAVEGDAMSPSLSLVWSLSENGGHPPAPAERA